LHLERLQQTSKFLSIPLPKKLQEHCTELIRAAGLPAGLLRLQVSRGVGERGYSTRNCGEPSYFMTIHPPPPPPAPVRLTFFNRAVFSGDLLLRHKTSNKLLHVLAKQQAEQNGFDDAILLNQNGEVTEATSSNLFAIFGQKIMTPPVECGLLPGINRGKLLRSRSPFEVHQQIITPENLLLADSIFLTRTGAPLLKVAAVEGRSFSSSEIVDRLNTFLSGVQGMAQPA
jgi:branched-chain amino acid aminotransferase